MAFAVSVQWRAKRGCEQKVEALLRVMQELTRKEPGCRHYYVHRTREPGRFVLYEQYVDRAAFDAHHATEHYRQLVRRDAPDLVEDRAIVECETF